MLARFEVIPDDSCTENLNTMTGTIQANVTEVICYVDCHAVVLITDLGQRFVICFQDRVGTKSFSEILFKRHALNASTVMDARAIAFVGDVWGALAQNPRAVSLSKTHPKSIGKLDYSGVKEVSLCTQDFM